MKIGSLKVRERVSSTKLFFGYRSLPCCSGVSLRNTSASPNLNRVSSDDALTTDRLDYIVCNPSLVKLRLVVNQVVKTEVLKRTMKIVGELHSGG
jgi:hypothetical protein